MRRVIAMVGLWSAICMPLDADEVQLKTEPQYELAISKELPDSFKQTDYCLSNSVNNQVLCGRAHFCMVDVDTGKIVRKFKDTHGRMLSLALSPDGRHAATFTDDLSQDRGSELSLWDLNGGGQRSLGHIDSYGRIFFASSGSNIIAISNNPEGCSRWSTTGAYNPESIAIRHAALCRNGKYLLTVSKANNCTFISCDDFKPIAATKISGKTFARGRYYYLQVSPDGKQMVVAHDATAPQGPLLRVKPAELSIYSIASGKRLLQTTEIDAVGSVDWSPDGSKIIIGEIGKALILDATTGKTLLRLKTGESSPRAVWSSDGKKAITLDFDGNLAIWEIDTK